MRPPGTGIAQGRPSSPPPAPRPPRRQSPALSICSRSPPRLLECLRIARFVRRQREKTSSRRIYTQTRRAELDCAASDVAERRLIGGRRGHVIPQGGGRG